MVLHRARANRGDQTAEGGEKAAGTDKTGSPEEGQRPSGSQQTQEEPRYQSEADQNCGTLETVSILQYRCQHSPLLLYMSLRSSHAVQPWAQTLNFTIPGEMSQERVSQSNY